MASQRPRGKRQNGAYGRGGADGVGCHLATTVLVVDGRGRSGGTGDGDGVSGEKEGERSLRQGIANGFSIYNCRDELESSGIPLEVAAIPAAHLHTGNCSLPATAGIWRGDA